ncbi:MAG: adenosylhomocysteinase [Candidatus Bathyarchaeia archaeon]|nr:adenosylhomocysteinase [Candidatus Bathyarchaeota archaeon]
MESRIKDLSLANEGKKIVEWAESKMPVLAKIKKRFEKEKPLKGVKIGACLHVTKETAVLTKTLIAGGAKVFLCASNPLSTQDEVAAALVDEGVNVYAWRGETTKDYYENLVMVLANEPEVTIDDGADLVATIHKERLDLIDKIIGGTEETTTGVVRLKALAERGELKYPIIAVNEAKSKSLFDNPIGTGQSALDGIMRATNVLLAGKNVVVVGYGRVGSGIAEKARGLGAKVTIVEVDPIKALKAAMSGYNVTSMSKASIYGDIFITATGNINVIREEHMKKMKDGTILANAGHFDVEISKPDLNKISIKKERISTCVEQYTLQNGRKLYLLAEGRLVNLGCAEGHPSEVMDLSFSIQALSVEYIVKNKGKLPHKVIDVPLDIDFEVAKLKLQSMDAELEELTEEQKRYLSSWELGTI